MNTGTYLTRSLSIIGNGLIEAGELDSFLTDLCEELGAEVSYFRSYKYIWNELYFFLFGHMYKCVCVIAISIYLTAHELRWSSAWAIKTLPLRKSSTICAYERQTVNGLNVNQVTRKAIGKPVNRLYHIRPEQYISITQQVNLFILENSMKKDLFAYILLNSIHMNGMTWTAFRRRPNTDNQAFRLKCYPFRVLQFKPRILH